MKYNLANQAEAGRALTYLLELTQAGKLAEVKAISPQRSLNQNSYLHVLIHAFAQHFGYTAEEAKTIYKRDVNANIYVYDKNGSKFLRSSADLTKDEMTTSIDHFRQFSAEQGYPLPPATDQGWLMEIQNAIEQSQRYL